MDLPNEEKVEYYKNMTVHPSGVSKDKIPYKAELTMTDADLEAFYSERYTDVDVASFLENERKEQLFGLCNMVKQREFFLDIGCADGGHMNVLYQRGIFGIGLDLAIPNILRGRAKYPHLKFIHGFAEEIPFIDNFFNVVLLGDVIEHFRNPRAVLSECLRVARTGLVICIPIKEEITEEHINPFDVNRIFSLLDLFNLKILLFNPEGEIISRETAVSGLNDFPWLLIRAEKSDSSDDEIKKFRDVYTSEIEMRGKTELLANDQWKIGDFHSRDPTEIARFNLVSHLIEGNRVLEIGSGNGDSTISLSKTAGEVVGVDISETGIRDAYEYSKTQGLASLPTFYVMDATALAFPDETFDTVVIPEVIEHVRSSRKIFQEAIRVVRNGGRIIFSVPDGLLVPWSGHLRIFFKDTLTTELSQYSDTISWHDLPFKKWIIGSFFVKKEHAVQITGPAIDILMPSYNGRSTIKRAIQSIIDQTYTNWNLIVINDGGEDLGDIIEKFQDPRIKYITSEHKGKSHALNIGIQNSNEGYITYLDDDDLVYPIHLEELVRGINKENAEFIYVDWYEVSYDEKNTEFSRGIECRQDVTPDMLITHNYINHKCILHTRKLINEIGGYDEDLSVFIDWDIIRRMAFKVRPVHSWTLTSEHIRYYEKNTLRNRITALWTQDKNKALESVLKIINKTDALGATIEDLNLAINSALTIIHYYQYPRLQELNQDVQTKEEQIQSFKQEINVKESQMEIFKRQIEEMSDQISSLQQSTSSKDQQIVDISVKIECLERQIVKNNIQQDESYKYLKTLEETISDKDNQILDLTTRLNDRDRELLSIEQSIVWQCTQKFHKKIIERLLPQLTRRRKYYDLVRTGGKNLINHGYQTSYQTVDRYFQEKTYLNDYQEWIEKNEPTSDELIQLKKISKNFSYRPKISIITPIWNTDEKILRPAIESVINQVYDNWELCIVDGNSTNPNIKKILTNFSNDDTRIKTKFLDKNLGISGNSNVALSIASGEFITFLDHDDTFAPFALFEVVNSLNKNSDLDLIYSDKDLLTEDGKERFNPLFKPDWSPEILLSANYLAHLCVIRRSILEVTGNLNAEMDGAQDWDLFFRITEKTNRIYHIPKILYHWRCIDTSCAQLGAQAKPYVIGAQKLVLEMHLKRCGLKGEIIFRDPGLWYVKWDIPSQKKVSIIIPSRNIHLLKTCIDSIFNCTDYKNYEIVVIDTGIDESACPDYYKALLNNKSIQVVKYSGDFNYSLANNIGSSHAKGEILLFLNDDIKVISPDWMDEMMGWVIQKDTGVVGAKLLKPDKTIQHAGVIIGLTGFAGHPFAGANEITMGPFGSSEWYRDYHAVTGACLMVKRGVYEEVGGFDEEFTLCGSDVEFCLRVERRGYKIIYNPFARLEHLESVSRGTVIPIKDFKLSYQHYQPYIEAGDPFFNKNLSYWNTIPKIKKPGEKEPIDFVKDMIQ
jgi:O-antigen biosynthesis protein